MAQTLGTATIQFVTYTERTLSSGVTINYVDGSALSVSTNGQAITVTLDSGVTTNADVKSALLVPSEASQLLSNISIAATHDTDVVTAEGPVSFTGQADTAPVRIPIPTIASSDPTPN